MPEGDTIWRAAHTLDRALASRRITAARATVPRVRAESLVGARVERVEARGKHLLIHFDDGRALHSHMRMTGSWHIYRPGERWYGHPSQARVVLETDQFVAVCFRAPVIELLTPLALAHHPELASLGPDLLLDDSVPAGVRALQANGELTIGEALLAQRVVAGIGNVYKSEVLFLCGMNPFAAVSTFSFAQLERALETAQRLMRQNLKGAARRTRSLLGAGDRYWVYRRRGPCHRCGTPIRMQRQGSARRSTYFCPSCQHDA